MSVIGPPVCMKYRCKTKKHCNKKNKQWIWVLMVQFVLKKQSLCLVFGEKWHWYQQNHQVTMWSSMTLCQSLRALTVVFTSEWRFCAHTWMTVFKQWFCGNLFYIAVCVYTVQFNSLYTISLLIQTKIQGTMYLLTRSKHKSPPQKQQQHQQLCFRLFRFFIFMLTRFVHV